MDDSHTGSDPMMTSASITMTTTSTSTSTSGSGYGIRRGVLHDDDDDDVDGMGTPSYAVEPPKKRLRSTASMLLDAAVETVIFTGAVALSAYQLLTGKSKGNNGHSQQPSSSDENMDIAGGDAVKAQEEDPMEEKLALQLDMTAPEMSRAATRSFSQGHSRNVSSSSSSTRMSGYHKAKTARTFRSNRQSYSAPRPQHLLLGHTRSPSMPVRPNTGTEDTDEAFLRMEAQLNSLIAEGKRALNSRVEVWDEE
ncbi:hypothetical protein EDD11_008482 [Mortierella claussenii]|nr:hypothetical protein EDD11_008482 [Mortierella claussenii]